MTAEHKTSDIKSETVTTESIVYNKDAEGNWVESSKKVDVTFVEREFRE